MVGYILDVQYERSKIIYKSILLINNDNDNDNDNEITLFRHIFIIYRIYFY